MTAPFALGRMMQTRGVHHAAFLDPAFEREIGHALARHAAGDFAEMSAEDRAANQLAIEQGGERVFSAYETSRGRVWIITEADRSFTTVLFPREY